MGVLPLARRLRTRLHPLCSRPEFNVAYHRSSHLRPRRCWFGERDDNDYVLLRIFEDAGDAVAYRPGHVQRWIGDWTTGGWVDNR